LRPTLHCTLHRTTCPTLRPTSHCPPRCSPCRPSPGHVASAHATSLTSTFARSRRGTYINSCFCSGRPKVLWKFRFFLLATLQHVMSPTSTLARSRRVTSPTSTLARSHHVDPRQGTPGHATSPTLTLARSRRGTSQLNCGLPVFNHLPAGDALSPAGNARNDVIVERPVVRRGRGRAHRGPLLREGIVGQGSY
jgi:hypothetical protein